MAVVSQAGPTASFAIDPYPQTMRATETLQQVRAEGSKAIHFQSYLVRTRSGWWVSVCFCPIHNQWRKVTPTLASFWLIFLSLTWEFDDIFNSNSLTPLPSAWSFHILQNFVFCRHLWKLTKRISLSPQIGDLLGVQTKLISTCHQNLNLVFLPK